MERLEGKVDKLQEDVTDLKVTQERILTSLDEHMRRTAIAEERIEMIQTQIEPLKNHTKVVDTLWKVAYYGAAAVVGLSSLGFFSWLTALIKKIN